MSTTLPFLFELGVEEIPHWMIVPALADLGARGVAWTLDVIGSGPLEDALRAQVARVGSGDRGRWLGRDAELSEVLPRAHAFVVATRAEKPGVSLTSKPP